MSHNLHALLIGIDFYLPSVSPEGAHYPSLNGCVQDVGLVESFLKTKLRLPDEHITKLTATNREPQGAPEPPEQLPTYASMVAAFQGLTERAAPGDQVYIHYSGHGGRVRTKFEDLKGRNALDETLVPTDIGDTEARHLRDIELAHLLKAMEKKGLIVTITLDSCHSGSATRGPSNSAVRGVDDPDLTERPRESLVASDEELHATWAAVSKGTTRDLALGSGWLPEPEGYVLLAACRASELANETMFGTSRHGALTYWLLDTLKQLGPNLTYKALHERVVGKVHSSFPSQTPQLHGAADRVVFGVDEVVPQFAVNVLDVDDAAGRVRVSTGQAQGIRKGAKFVVYPPGTDFSDVDRRVAVIEVGEVGATDSWAEIVEKLSDEKFEAGSQAVLHDPGNIPLRRTVAIAHRDDLPASIDQYGALSAVEARIADHGEGFVELADDDRVDFQVAITDESTFEIHDPSGQPLANLRPEIELTEPGAPLRVAQRLVHLAKYRNVRDLANEDPMSPLAGALEVELLGVQKDFVRGDPPRPEPFSDPGNTPDLSPGDWTFLRIRNSSAQPLNLTALDLTPRWAVTQIYPGRADTAYMHFDPGQEVTLPLQASLAEGHSEGVDVIKVFATVGATNFRWLELPPLDAPPTRGVDNRGKPANALEALLAAATVDQPRTREMTAGANPAAEWTSGQIEIRVSREPVPKPGG